MTPLYPARGQGADVLARAGLDRHRQARLIGWGLAVFMAVIGTLLLILLAQATNNRALYERYYFLIFVVNGVVALVLCVLTAWIAARLWRRYRQGKFGSRLLIKLAATFALVGLVPGVLIYTVSYQFVARSIESWFDVKVEGALESGLNLGRAVLDSVGSDTTTKAQAAAAVLGSVSDSASGVVLEQLREQYGFDDAALWSAAGNLIASVGESRFSLTGARPSPAVFRSLRTRKSSVTIEGFDGIEAAALVRVLVPVAPVGFRLGSEPRYLQVVKRLPPSLAENARAVQQANQEYQERALGRVGLRRMYIGTLTLSLFFAVFGAVLIAVLLGDQIARPLLVLADGVREVAAGNLAPKAVASNNDELGGLTRAFADMTHQLDEARRVANQSRSLLETSRASLQTVLDNLTAGVVVLDKTDHIFLANPGATRVLRSPIGAHVGSALSGVPGLEPLAAEVLREFDSLTPDEGTRGLDHWQRSFDLPGAGGGHGGDAAAIHLFVRGALLPDGDRLLVFDDISAIVSAQRAVAWGEVARRLAHEIKNPLTPIRLSAERVAMKLAGKLAPVDAAMLNKSVNTIVAQVDAMKRLVDEFRDYARLPVADLVPLQVNTLVHDILQMYHPDAGTVSVSYELDPACPLIMGDAQLLRQVIHNLVQNAQDACETGTSQGGTPAVMVKTQYRATSATVRLVVEDNGPGFPEALLVRALEPYVTTKSKGTGLGLAVVKKIADEHGARLEVSNRRMGDAVRGARISLSFGIVPVPMLATGSASEPGQSLF
jgi:nitrogen fixation/metabolism regulation signal transduction histidine kinase